MPIAYACNAVPALWIAAKSNPCQRCSIKVGEPEAADRSSRSKQHHPVK